MPKKSRRTTPRKTFQTTSDVLRENTTHDKITWSRKKHNAQCSQNNISWSPKKNRLCEKMPKRKTAEIRIKDVWTPVQRWALRSTLTQIQEEQPEALPSTQLQKFRCTRQIWSGTCSWPLSQQYPKKLLRTMILMAQPSEIFSSRYHALTFLHVQVNMMARMLLPREAAFNFCYASEYSSHGPRCLAQRLSAIPTRLFILYTGVTKHKSLHLEMAAATGPSSLVLGPTQDCNQGLTPAELLSVILPSRSLGFFEKLRCSFKARTAHQRPWISFTWEHELETTWMFKRPNPIQQGNKPVILFSSVVNQKHYLGKRPENSMGE